MFQKTEKRLINLIVVHTAQTKPSMDYVDAAWIDHIHRTEKKFNSIGYHHVIKRDGTLERGRPHDNIGAHVRGYNSDSIGICMAGGLSEDGEHFVDNYTSEQMNTLYNLITEMLKAYPEAELRGHRDLDSHKACPCFDVRTWYEMERSIKNTHPAKNEHKFTGTAPAEVSRSEAFNSWFARINELVRRLGF